jgi:hypothetical protein
MIRIVVSPISRSELQAIVNASPFDDLVKAVVDIERGVMAIGGELHADEERELLEDGSTQRNLWGINLHPQAEGDAMIEFDSMINVRPSLGNRTRSVDDPVAQRQIIALVKRLVVD